MFLSLAEDLPKGCFLTADERLIAKVKTTKYAPLLRTLADFSPVTDT